MERYNRQILLPEIGEDGQQKILASSVLIVGAGGLGSPIALYLTAAGVGRIGIIDDDKVSLTNLQRQVLYTTSEIGLLKTDCAKRRLQALSPDTIIEPYQTRLDDSNAEDLISKYDMVIDGSDNYATRYLIDDVCRKYQKPYVYGAIGEFSGQVSVFNYKGGKSYQDLFPDRSLLTQTKNRVLGVVGTIPAVIGSIEATEALKIMVEMPTVLRNKIFTIDLRTLSTHVIEI